MLKKTGLLSMLFLLISLLFASTSLSQTQNSLAEKVANTYGFKNFSKVKSISFTFNVKTQKGAVSRSWYWEPATNKVTYKGPGKDGKPMTYSYITG